MSAARAAEDLICDKVGWSCTEFTGQTAYDINDPVAGCATGGTPLRESPGKPETEPANDSLTGRIHLGPHVGCHERQTVGRADSRSRNRVGQQPRISDSLAARVGIPVRCRSYHHTMVWESGPLQERVELIGGGDGRGVVVGVEAEYALDDLDAEVVIDERQQLVIGRDERRARMRTETAFARQPDGNTGVRDAEPGFVERDLSGRSDSVDLAGERAQKIRVETFDHGDVEADDGERTSQLAFLPVLGRQHEPARWVPSDEITIAREVARATRRCSSRRTLGRTTGGGRGLTRHRRG